MNILADHIKLLTPALFLDHTSFLTFDLVVGVFTSHAWNLLIPLGDFSIEDYYKTVDEYGKQRDFSIYLAKSKLPTYERQLGGNGIKNRLIDSFVGVELSKVSYPTLDSKFQVELLDPSDYRSFLTVSSDVFPDYPDNNEYCNHILSLGTNIGSTQLRTFVVKDGAKIISFGSVIYSKLTGVAYLHNSGTESMYRRQGLYSLIKHRIFEELKSNQIDFVYAIVTPGSNSDKALSSYGFREVGNYSVYY